MAVKVKYVTNARRFIKQLISINMRFYHNDTSNLQKKEMKNACRKEKCLATPM